MSDRHSGTVKWFNNAKGFGFITRQEKMRMYLFISALFRARATAL